MDEPERPDEPQPRYAPAHGDRQARRDARPEPGPTAVARPEPVVDIRPPVWFARLSVVAAALVALLGLGTGIANAVAGNVVPAVLCLAAGALLAAMAFDAAGRRATSHGDELELHQWFGTATLRRHQVEEFGAARASFFRWDVVAVPFEGTQTRIWVTRMLPAGRRTRQAWLAELESWRTWVGPPGPG